MHKLMPASALLIGVLFTGGCALPVRPHRISGHVLDSRTGDPIEKSVVRVVWHGPLIRDLGLSKGETEMHTTEDGAFSLVARNLRDRHGYAHRRGIPETVEAFAQGYYARRVYLELSWWHGSRRRIEIQMDRIVSPRDLPFDHTHLRDFRFGSRGFSFSQGRAVSEDWDFKFEDGWLTAGGAGGFIKTDNFLDSMTTAPESGYRRRLRTHRGSRSLLAFHPVWVRCADGKRYAKMTIIVPTMPSDKERVKSIEYCFYWAYQPDGSRSLEAPRIQMKYPRGHVPVPPEQMRASDAEGH